MQEYSRPQIPEAQLVKELNKILKANGYARVGRKKEWSKQIETGFVLRFLVQGSRWDKDDYDVRIGVSIVGVQPCDNSPNGQFEKQLNVFSSEQVYNDAVKFFDEWTDIMLVRERVQAIKEWRDRNPAEYLWTLPREKREKPPFKVPIQEPAVCDYVLSPKYLEDRKQFLKQNDF